MAKRIIKKLDDDATEKLFLKFLGSASNLDDQFRLVKSRQDDVIGRLTVLETKLDDHMKYSEADHINSKNTLTTLSINFAAMQADLTDVKQHADVLNTEEGQIVERLDKMEKSWAGLEPLIPAVKTLITKWADFENTTNTLKKLGYFIAAVMIFVAGFVAVLTYFHI